jgi:predicted amidohydrolase YtcJ
VAPFAPLFGIQSSVTRMTRAAGVVGPEWAITVPKAVRMYTEWSAWCAFEETDTASLEPGKAADVTCLSTNILQNPESLPDADVTWTMAGGLVTHADA